MQIWYKSHETGETIGLTFDRLATAQYCWDMLSNAGCIMVCKRP